MSKMLAATCVGGVVTAEGFPVPAARVLSEGVGASEGVLLIDEDEVRYLAKISPDLKTAIENVVSALGQTVTALTNVATTFTATFAAMTGPTTAPPPTGAAGVVNITSAITAITAAQTQLSALKEILR